MTNLFPVLNLVGLLLGVAGFLLLSWSLQTHPLGRPMFGGDREHRRDRLGVNLALAGFALQALAGIGELFG